MPLQNESASRVAAPYNPRSLPDPLLTPSTGPRPQTRTTSCPLPASSAGGPGPRRRTPSSRAASTTFASSARCRCAGSGTGQAVKHTLTMNSSSALQVEELLYCMPLAQQHICCQPCQLLRTAPVPCALAAQCQDSKVLCVRAAHRRHLQRGTRDHSQGEGAGAQGWWREQRLKLACAAHAGRATSLCCLSASCFIIRL